jgi:hypothetical protein
LPNFVSRSSPVILQDALRQESFGDSQQGQHKAAPHPHTVLDTSKGYWGPMGMAVQAARIARERDRVEQEAEVATMVSQFLVGLFEVSDPEGLLKAELSQWLRRPPQDDGGRISSHGKSYSEGLPAPVRF